jgi:hypothetical protein
VAITEKSLANLKQFSSEYRPATTGRKPSQLKKYIKETNINREDVAAMIKTVLFQKNYQELKLLVSDDYQPMIIRLFVKAFLNDFKNGSLVNLQVMLDRAFGAPKQDITVSGEITVTTMTYEQRKELIDEYLKERAHYVQGSAEPADRQDHGVPGEFEEVIQEESGEAQD